MSKKTSRAYPTELILEILQKNESEHIGPSQLARDYEVPVTTVKYWLKEYRSKGYAAFGNNKRQGHYMTFNGAFKQRVMTFWLEHPEMSCHEVCREFSIARSTLRQWKKVYDTKGMDGFLRETRGRKRKVERQKEIVQSKKTDKEKIKELESQLEYLQAENEYLKKLNALVREKESQRMPKK